MGAEGQLAERRQPTNAVLRWSVAVFGVICVVAVVVIAMSWSAQRSDAAERDYRGRVLKTATTWTGTLINLTAATVAAGMPSLRENTVGELNSDFETAMQPYRQLAEQLPVGATGRVEAAAIVAQRYGPGGAVRPLEREGHPPVPGARRSDPVMVVASTLVPSTGERSGRSRNVRWTLQLEVSDVDGRLLISRMGAS